MFTLIEAKKELQKVRRWAVPFVALLIVLTWIFTPIIYLGCAISGLSKVFCYKREDIEPEEKASE